MIRVSKQTKEILQAIVERSNGIKTYDDAVMFFIHQASEKTITEDIEGERDRTINALEHIMEKFGVPKKDQKAVGEMTHAFFAHLIPILNGKVPPSNLIIAFKKEAKND